MRIITSDHNEYRFIINLERLDCVVMRKAKELHQVWAHFTTEGGEGKFYSVSVFSSEKECDAKNAYNSIVREIQAEMKR